MCDAIRHIVGRGQRDRLVVALQSYARSGTLMADSLGKALTALRLDYTEVFAYLQGQGVVPYSATPWGHLLQTRRTPPGEQPPSSRAGYRFARTHPKVDDCLCAPRNMQQKEEALQTLKHGPLDVDELGRMRSIGDHVHHRRALF